MTGSASKSPESSPRPVAAGRCARGRLAPPPSKSLTHRYFNLALLARRPLIVERPLDAEDTRLFRAALGRLGFRVEADASGLTIAPGATATAEAEIDCGNAGTLLRFLTAGLTTLPGSWRLDGTPRLRERPVGPLVAALRRLGAAIEYAGSDGFPPLIIRGGTLGGGSTRLDAGESSQYLSALLMAALAAGGPVTVEVAALTSAPYVELTLAAIAELGGAVERPAPGVFRVRPGPLGDVGRVRVEGDFSAACYPAAAAALTGGPVILTGLDVGSRQGDRGFFDLLARMGARVDWRPGGEVEVAAPPAGTLAAVAADLGGMPDQVPTLSALAPFARGTTTITGVAHLRIKESDRLAAMAAELTRLGAAAEERSDGLVIPGVWADRPPPESAVVVESHGDHRIAMSLAVAALRRPGVSVADPAVVAKSYPAFWHDFDALLGRGAAPW